MVVSNQDCRMKYQIYQHIITTQPTFAHVNEHHKRQRCKKRLMHVPCRVRQEKYKRNDQDFMASLNLVCGGGEQDNEEHT